MPPPPYVDPGPQPQRDAASAGKGLQAPPAQAHRADYRPVDPSYADSIPQTCSAPICPSETRFVGKPTLCLFERHEERAHRAG